jgi:C_GCAxxG_C_C family probable redox protein
MGASGLPSGSGEVEAVVCSDMSKPGNEQLARMIGERAQNLYLTRQLLCSEAVLVVMNRGLDGGLSDEVAIRLASALPIGIGDSGCTCGALSGAVLALGLFLGRDRPCAPDSKQAMPAAKLLHNRFKESFGSTCCRALSKKVKHNPSQHFKQCARITAQTAEFAALIVLEKRPELGEEDGVAYLEARDSWVASQLRRLVNLARL